MKRINDFINEWVLNARIRLHAFKSIVRSLPVYIILIIALALIIASGPLSAQAAPAKDSFRFHILAKKIKGNATICVGDNVPIYVRVMRSQMTGNQGDNVQNIPGVRVDASMSNAGIGSLTPKTSYTGWNLKDSGGANFNFRAEKAGTTTIHVKGTINHIWWLANLGLPPVVDRRDFVNSEVEIKVEDCSYKVTTTSRWSADEVNWVAKIDQAGMTTDAPGHYTGTATVDWVLSEFPPPIGSCPLQEFKASSDANLTGELVGPDLLVVNIIFKPVDVTWLTWNWILEECMIGGNVTWHPAPDQLRFNFPVSGGEAHPSQTLFYFGQPSEWDIPGDIKVIVERMTDK